MAGSRVAASLLGLALVAGSAAAEPEPDAGEVIELSGRAPSQTEPLSYQLTVDDIRSLPGAGNDVLRAVQVLPGVARIPFAFGGLVLRGSSPRDSAVFVDGVAVPLAFHFGGLTSIYPGGMLADLTLTAGGFDASHGRAQGGLVTLTTREPRRDRFRLGGSVGLFDSSVQAEGPLAGGGGFVLGIRRSYLDAVAAPFVADDLPLPSYWDIQLRTSWGDPRGRGRISPMLFGAIDRVVSNELSLTSAFVRVAAPYHRQWGALALRVAPWLGSTRLMFAEEADPDEPGSTRETFARPVHTAGVRGELLRDFAWGHLRGGIDLEAGYLAQSQLGVTGDGPTMSTDGESAFGWADLALWGELRWRLADRLSLKPGLRVDALGLTGEVVVDPRLNLELALAPGTTLRQAFGRFHQPPTPGDVDPRDGNPQLDSSHVDQLSLGIESELPAEIHAAVTGFFHLGDGLGVRVTPPRVGAEAPEPNLGGLGPTFELLLEKQLGFSSYRIGVGRMRAYGIELAARRRVGRWFALLSYTLARSERTDDPRAGRGWRPFELDQRHNLQAVGAVQLGRWQLGARLQLVSGNPYTADPRAPWQANLPLFAAVDLRVDRRWHRCWGDIVAYVDVHNALDRRNIEGRDLETNGDGTRRIEDIRGLPLVPFVGVEFQPLR